MKGEIVTSQNVANVGFLEECFILCMLGKDEKHSRISENFLDIWAGQSLSKRNQEKSSNSQI